MGGLQERLAERVRQVSVRQQEGTFTSGTAEQMGQVFNGLQVLYFSVGPRGNDGLPPGVYAETNVTEKQVGASAPLRIALNTMVASVLFGYAEDAPIVVFRRSFPNTNGRMVVELEAREPY